MLLHLFLKKTLKIGVDVGGQNRVGHQVLEVKNPNTCNLTMPELKGKLPRSQTPFNLYMTMQEM